MTALSFDGAGGEVVGSKFELFVSDSAESAAFYSALGFDVVHEKPGGYATLRSGPTVIALSPLPWWLPVRWLGFLRNPPLGTEIVLYVEDLDRSRASAEHAGYSPGPITLQSWGDRDFRVSDPDGYYVRVSTGTAVPRGEAP
jgi:catechol 2,3-dioxygenase-like lactoylglutathione lyase family enzyme